MIHGQNTVIIFIRTCSKKSIGSKRSETGHAFFYQFLYCRNDHILFLVTQQAVISGMRIKCQDCYTRFLNGKIGFQRTLKNMNLTHYGLFGYGIGYFPQRQMGCYQSHL